MRKHTTHWACPEQMEKHGGNALCCKCEEHKCKPIATFTKFEKDGYSSVSVEVHEPKKKKVKKQIKNNVVKE